METIKIASINRYDKTSKSTGKPFVSVSIKTEDGRSISGFGNKDNQGWQAGDEVDVIIEQKGEYLNFVTPKATFKKAGGSYQPAPDLNRLEVKQDAGFNSIRTELQMMKTVLADILQKVDPAIKDDSPF